MRGLVPIRDLADYYYDFDEKTTVCRTQDPHTLLRLATAYACKWYANIEKRMVDFALFYSRKGRPVGVVQCKEVSVPKHSPDVQVRDAVQSSVVELTAPRPPRLTRFAANEWSTSTIRIWHYQSDD